MILNWKETASVKQKSKLTQPFETSHIKDKENILKSSKEKKKTITKGKEQVSDCSGTTSDDGKVHTLPGKSVQASAFPLTRTFISNQILNERAK